MKRPHRLEEDLGFPTGSQKTLEAMNHWDFLLYELGHTMFKMDAAFHATAGVVSARF